MATWSDEDKARAYVALAANDGNVKRTAREIGVPENTLRRWRDDWQQNGPPQTEDVEMAMGEFLEEASNLRGRALLALKLKVEQLIKDPKAVKVAELTTLVGVLDDKITRASGLATSRTEHVHTLPSPDEIREALGQVFQGALDAAKQRAEDIQDADFTEVGETPALPPASP